MKIKERLGDVSIYGFVFIDEAINPKRCSQILNKKCGSDSTTEVECKLFGCCYLNGKCFYDNTAMAGFVQIRKNSNFQTFYNIIISINVKECTRHCLSSSQCRCFEYDFKRTVCTLSKEACNAQNDSETISSYERIGFSSLTCYNADCGHLDQFNKTDLYECKTDCEVQSNCEFIIYAGDNREKKCTHLPSSNCDFSDSKRRFAYMNSCVLGPVFKDVYQQNDNKLLQITDQQSENTCIDVKADEDFSLRIPWPSVSTISPNFKLNIFGENLHKCIDLKNSLPPVGVLAYIPLDYQNDPIFIGNFLSCQLLNGDDNTVCEYFCSCQMDYCQSVYIKAITNTNNNMKICHYTVVQL
ncbi:unnamed protein product [Dimorphilus gyrociliatus]|uniref:Apple domain-containing protein n=1 Tax=Dimorphilus gyrociliatus TaxID=2664684 RepID=A0A7I8WEC2_9ANNE|nr:unnamed protein product [Dimorphilus gyrociliatus]